GNLARYSNRLNVGLMELDRAVAGRQGARDRLSDLARRVVAQETRVNAQPRLAEAAEQLVDWNASGLAGQIPERQLDAAHRHHRQAAPPPDHQRVVYTIDEALALC